VAASAKPTEIFDLKMVPSDLDDFNTFGFGDGGIIRREQK
jgi:hypothetical protein